MLSAKKLFDGFENLWDEAEKKLDVNHFHSLLCRIYGILIVRGNEEILKGNQKAFENELIHQEKKIKEEL